MSKFLHDDDLEGAMTLLDIFFKNCSGIKLNLFDNFEKKAFFSCIFYGCRKSSISCYTVPPALQQPPNKGHPFEEMPYLFRKHTMINQTKPPFE